MSCNSRIILYFTSMDDIQFWVYLIFGGIYLVSRILKKKGGDAVPHKPARRHTSAPSGGTNKPVSFEELLKEFTEGSATEEMKEEQPEPVDSSEVLRRRQWAPKEESRPSYESEGRTRVFADDESKRVYEESIKNAEGADLAFERDDHFKIKLKSKSTEEAPTPELASEITNMLRDSDEAKKAVILGEILNRKY